MRARARIVVRGTVQGVGFRPYVYRLAREHGLGGWVSNTGDGVVIDVEGDEVERFASEIAAKAPPLARVENLQVTMLPPVGYTSFAIQESQESAQVEALVPPDVAVCPDCLRELLDRGDRRYHYPFTNCTNCGPRFTITEEIPYDRPKTTMRVFHMCPQCEAEYHDPLDRRFHAQPNACPVCGPSVWLERAGRRLGEQENGGSGPSALPLPNCPTPSLSPDAAIEEARRLLAAGEIVAVKGLGGFHLACDATNDLAVARLRQRKGREEKPFAIMVRDLATAEGLCHVSDAERRLLESPVRPIVLLRRRVESSISPLVAPGNRYLGVMLPYTPLHHLLLAASDEEMGRSRAYGTGERSRRRGGRGPRGQGPTFPGSCSVLVMTSGNLSEEPIAIGNREARERLARLADAFLLHNRDIYMRCDDSVVRVVGGREVPIRRARGYVPSSVVLSRSLPPVLAVGAELKNTFCLARDSRAYVSQHIGDLQNLETLSAFEEAVDHFRRFLRIEPEVVAHDLHPDYLSTQYAQELQAKAEKRGSGEDATEKQERRAILPSAVYGVQHHHAHIASCMADNGLDGRVVGVAFDGTGYGPDGTLWGGEFLVCDYARYERHAHLAALALPGGEAAIHKPYRMALSYLHRAYGNLDHSASFFPSLSDAEMDVISKQAEGALNSPLTSSCGRLFDAVSALLGIRPIASYEGQAAIELEMAAAEGVDESYPWPLDLQHWPLSIDPSPVVRAVVEDALAEVPRSVIAARFHNAVADMVVEVGSALGQATGLSRVCLSGGVFQNVYLLTRVVRGLKGRGLQPYFHHRVPANDGGISLGQAMVAGARFQGEKE